MTNNVRGVRFYILWLVTVYSNCKYFLHRPSIKYITLISKIVCFKGSIFTMSISMSCQTFFAWNGARQSRASWTVADAFLFRLRTVLGLSSLTSFLIWYVIGLIFPPPIMFSALFISSNVFLCMSFSALHDDIWDDGRETFKK